MARLTNSDVSSYENRVIVAGSRRFNDYLSFSASIQDYVMINDLSKEDTVFITGFASSGADKLIVDWCEQHGWDYLPVPAKWDELEAPGAFIKKNSSGKEYNANAGFDRNTAMAKIANKIIVFWDGKSPGTSHMLKVALKYNLQLFSVKIKV